MRASSQDNQIEDWSNLLHATRDCEGELSRVSTLVATFEESYDQAVSLRARRDALLASAMETTAQMKEAFAESHDAALALRSYIKAVLGPRSKELVRFGIKPLRGRGRKS
jgi:hypothetical protein